MDTIRKYQSLKDKVTERKEPFKNFIAMLENETSWLTRPASSMHHDSREGDLLQHSVGVTENLIRFSKQFGHEISEESCVIVGLFHDVEKIIIPDTPLYLPDDNEHHIKKGIRYRYHPDIIPMRPALRSLYITARYLPLSSPEAQAIAYHDGLYGNGSEIVAHNDEPLTLLLHWADYWTSYLHEEKRELRDKRAYHSTIIRQALPTVQ